MRSRSRMAAISRPSRPAPTISTFCSPPRAIRPDATRRCHRFNSKPSADAATPAVSELTECSFLAATWPANRGIRPGGVGRPEFSGFDVAGKDTLGQLQFVSFNRDRHRTLNALDRDDQRLRATLCQNAFQTLEATAPNSHPLSHFQKRVQ